MQRRRRRRSSSSSSAETVLSTVLRWRSPASLSEPPRATPLSFVGYIARRGVGVIDCLHPVSVSGGVLCQRPSRSPGRGAALSGRIAELMEQHPSTRSQSPSSILKQGFSAVHSFVCLRRRTSLLSAAASRSNVLFVPARMTGNYGKKRSVVSLPSTFLLSYRLQLFQPLLLFHEPFPLPPHGFVVLHSPVQSRLIFPQPQTPIGLQAAAKEHE